MDDRPNDFMATATRAGRARGLVTLVVLVAVVQACGSDGRADQAHEVPDYQAVILQDWVVSTEEYNAALMLTLSCTQAAGARIDGPTAGPDGRLHFKYGARTLEELQVAGRAYDRCYDDYLREVDRFWAIQANEVRAGLAAQERALVECFIVAGIVKDEGELTPQRVRQVMATVPTLPEPAVSRCAYEVYEGRPLDEPK